MTYIVQQYFHNSVTPNDDIGAINKLRRQLSRNGVAKCINHTEFDTFLSGNILWIAREQNVLVKRKNIVAMGSVTPNIGFSRSDSFGYIQNVVTDEHHRGKKDKVTVQYPHNKRNRTQSVKHAGKSLAEIIVEEMICFARSCQCYGYLQLTSGPDRVTANELYRKLGFILTSGAPAAKAPYTNLYKLLL